MNYEIVVGIKGFVLSRQPQIVAGKGNAGVIRSCISAGSGVTNRAASGNQGFGFG
jgi:hypothetical protein